MNTLQYKNKITPHDKKKLAKYTCCQVLTNDVQRHTVVKYLLNLYQDKHDIQDTSL